MSIGGRPSKICIAAVGVLSNVYKQYYVVNLKKVCVFLSQLLVYQLVLLHELKIFIYVDCQILFKWRHGRRAFGLKRYLLPHYLIFWIFYLFLKTVVPVCCDLKETNTNVQVFYECTRIQLRILIIYCLIHVNPYKIILIYNMMDPFSI